MKQPRMVQTSPGHPPTLSMGRKNTKLNESSHTNNSDDQKDFNISSNGRDTLKATTHGSQPTKFMPLNLSSIINPQEHISHPQHAISQPLGRYISQHHLDQV